MAPLRWARAETVWYDETGSDHFIPALNVPDDRVIDTNGAGDIFHGAYVYSHLRDPDSPWERHFKFARAASAHAIQHLGNEAKICPRSRQINEDSGPIRRAPSSVRPCSWQLTSARSHRGQKAPDGDEEARRRLP